jgi:CDGSH-type Zn-finger protein
MFKEKSTPKIKIVKNGPYLVLGNIPMTKQTIIANEEGRVLKWEGDDCYPKQEEYALCRCGQSKNSPYCDGTDQKIEFDGTETASKEKYINRAGAIVGPELIITDLPELCAYARFCHREDGSVWELVEDSGNPKSRASAIQGAWDCPSGRLLAWEKTGQPIEEKHENAIGIVEDPTYKGGVSGPIWVKGGVLIESSDGSEYEVRNQVTLCRCGKSDNKPFCDNSHGLIVFKAKEGRE